MTSTEPWFEGYYIGPSTTQPIVCAPTTNQAYYTSGSYAGCCKSSTGCSLPTACADGLHPVFDDGSTQTCGSGLSCVAMTIFQTFPNGGPVVTKYGCKGNWVANTVYRELPATTTTTQTTTPAASETTRQSGSSNSASTNPSTSAGLSAGAWAGIGIAILAVIAVIILTFYLFRKKFAGRLGHQGYTGPVSQDERTPRLPGRRSGAFAWGQPTEE